MNNPIIFADPTGGLEYLTIIVHNDNGKEIARNNIKSPISNSSHVVSKRRDGVDGSLYREVNYYDIQTTINITLDTKKREITVNSIYKGSYGDSYLTLWGDAADTPAVVIFAELYGKVPSFKIWAGGSSDDGNKKGGRRNIIEIDWASDDFFKDNQDRILSKQMKWSDQQKDKLKATK